MLYDRKLQLKSRTYSCQSQSISSPFLLYSRKELNVSAHPPLFSRKIKVDFAKNKDRKYSLHRCSAVWPDWATFKRSSRQNFKKKLSKGVFIDSFSIRWPFKRSLLWNSFLFFVPRWVTLSNEPTYLYVLAFYDNKITIQT